MCAAYFQGNGYSEEFTRRMTEILRQMKLDEPLVRLTVGGDAICAGCPNLMNGVCVQRDKVAGYDKKVLELCGLEEGAVLPASRFRRLVREAILDKGLRERVCGDCQWSAICIDAFRNDIVE